MLLMDPAAGGGLSWSDAGAFAQASGTGRGLQCGERAVGGSITHRSSPGAWALRAGGPGGRERRGSETRPSDRASSNPLRGTSSSVPESFSPPVTSQQGQPAVFTLAAASVDQILIGMGGSVAVGLPHPFAYPLAGFQKLLQAWLWT